MSMERNKSTRESNAHALKEVLAEFDIETQVNKMVLRCFTDLMKTHRQAFDYVSESQKKLIDFEARLCKSQGFAASIQANVSSKVEITDNLNRRLETFTSEFHETIKQSEIRLQTIRKDYDNLVSNTQKHTYELRTLANDIKRSSTDTVRLEVKLDQALMRATQSQSESKAQLQTQLLEVRKESQRFMQLLAEARAEFISKGNNFEQVSHDMSLYKHEKQSLQNQFYDLLKEVETKLPKADFAEMRLLFDSQMVTDRQNNGNNFTMIRGSIEEETKERSEADIKLQKASEQIRIKQEQVNRRLQQQLINLRGELTSRTERLAKKTEEVEFNLRTELDALTRKQDKDQMNLIKQLQKQSTQLEKQQSYACDLQKIIQQHYEENIQLGSNFNALSDRFNQMMEQNQQRRKEMAKLDTSSSQKSLGQSIGSMSGLLDQLRQQIVDTRRAGSLVAKDLETSQNKIAALQQQLISRQKIWAETQVSDRSEMSNRFLQVNRRISQVSIELMGSIQKAEQEAKAYSDSLKNDIEDKLKSLEVMSEEMRVLKIAFQEQMAETQAVNRSITEKMQKTNATLTKFKSDLSLRVEAIVNEQQRRSLQIKQTSKTVEQARKMLSNISEAINILLSIVISREWLDQGQKEPVKVSSLLEGWVLQIQDKIVKYRGQLLQKRRLAQVCLNFMVFHSDKVKGTLIDSGKDVYNRMIEESQQIFTARKKGLSKKMGSQLPKLHF